MPASTGITTEAEHTARPLLAVVGAEAVSLYWLNGLFGGDTSSRTFRSCATALHVPNHKDSNLRV